MSDSHPRPIDPDTIDNAYDPDARMGEPYRAERMMAPAPVHHGISARPEAHHNQMEDGFCDEDNIDLYHDDNIDPARDDNVYHDEEDDFDPTRDYEEEASKQANGEPEEPRRREFKYSTASMPKRSRCRKWCLIFLLFLLFFAITTGISMLIDWLFFSDESDNAPFYPERDGNETFPQDKVFIDQVCSEGTTDFDGGARCREACQPQFLECCDPFNEFETHDYTESFLNATNTTLPPEEVYDDENKCLATNFDVCMDYAPCQNLRSGFIVETAPDDLDKACFWELPECFETCEKAECCGNPDSSCYNNNFLSCLTYAPCTNVTLTKVEVPPIYSRLEKPPAEFVYACNEEKVDVHDVVEKTCVEYCEPAMCCYNQNPTENCFRDDPLGCMAWDQECQVIFELQEDQP